MKNTPGQHRCAGLQCENRHFKVKPDSDIISWACFWNEVTMRFLFWPLLLALPAVTNTLRVPPDPGLYFLQGSDVSPIEGRSVTLARNSGKMPPIPLPMKSAIPQAQGHVNAQILGEHAEQKLISTPVFLYRAPDGGEATGAGDLVLVKLKAKHGRREFEISAEQTWTASAGISLRSQVRFYEKRVESGVYRIVPAQDLSPGEYGFYLYRGRDLPGFLYDFAVDSLPE
jgi:hypothetical protein